MKNAIYFLSASLLSISCSVGFSIDDPQQFSCQSNDDCESSYVCKSNICEREIPGPVGCPDDDSDGFGVGDERVTCQLCSQTPANGEGCIEDPDDNDPTVYPGAPEICDGKDNDNDGTVDNTQSPVGFESTVPPQGDLPFPKMKCVSANDCPQSTQEGVSSFCDADKCVARMTIYLGFAECNSNNLVCTDGAFPVVPENCGGPVQ